MPNTEIAALEMQIFEFTNKLNQLRKAEVGAEIRNVGSTGFPGRTRLAAPVRQ